MKKQVNFNISDKDMRIIDKIIDENIYINNFKHFVEIAVHTYIENYIKNEEIKKKDQE
jgi:hypothetical protein